MELVAKTIGENDKRGGLLLEGVGLAKTVVADYGLILDEFREIYCEAFPGQGNSTALNQDEIEPSPFGKAPWPLAQNRLRAPKDQHNIVKLDLSLVFAKAKVVS